MHDNATPDGASPDAGEEAQPQAGGDPPPAHGEGASGIASRGQDRGGEPWILTLRDPAGNVIWTASLPARLLPRARAAVLLLGLAAVGLVGSWAFLAARASQVPAMQRELAELSQEDGQVQRLAESLEEVESAYQRLRSLFADENMPAGALWLPPAGAGPNVRTDGLGDGGVGDPLSGTPALWPLTERGFLTRGLAPSEAGETGESAPETMAHPGIDVAVPSGSYFRAVASGRVVERGEDPIYGLFVVLEHPGGYRSLYGHASVVVVEPGRQVRPGEVLGLTGSSGRSSAPHLHLEITLNDEHLDPLALLNRPG